MVDLLLREYVPRPRLRVPVHEVERPRFPVFDGHNHLGSGHLPTRPVGELVAVLDESGVERVLDLDGGWGEHLRAEIARYVEPYPDRFVVFAGLDYSSWAADERFGETEAAHLRDSVSAGARGFKAWKLLGLRARDSRGHLVAVDDPRLAPLWATAGELGIPVAIHVADPIAFFDPLDRFNERWEELHHHPDWHFYPTRPTERAAEPGFPPFDEIMEQLDNVLARHPGTTFIGAHVGCAAEDLAWVARTLDTRPNFNVDISGRIGELGRQPYSAREFFLRYQDRILFGTDMPADVRSYRLHYRFLETRDEYFNYPPGSYPPGEVPSYDLGEVPGQGRWMIYGLDLPDDVLRKVYRDNANRLILGR